MAKRFPLLSDAHRDFIARQHVFFTASAAAGTRINISPRGTDGLRILDAGTVAYRDLTGSGNETAAHLLADGRLTLMFCAFDGAPLILRLYGRGRSLPCGDPEFAAVLDQHFGGEAPLGTRQIVVLAVDLVQTSCGYGVPMLDYAAERPTLGRWAEAKGAEGLERYRAEQNRFSMDGLPTSRWAADEPVSADA